MLKNNNMSSNDSHTTNIIGNGTIIKGEIESNGDIRIDGRVEGVLRSNGKIVLGEKGSVEGEMYCKQADLSGRVLGKITVEELTSLKSKSRIEGELTTKQLFIEVGAIFTGKCDMGKTETPKIETKK